MGNSLHGEKVKVLAPLSAKITNIFPNINKHMNVFTIRSVPFTIPIGFYNAVDLATAVNTAVAVYPAEGDLAFDTTTSRFTWTATVDPVVAELELWHALGFDVSQLTFTSGTQYTLPTPGATALHPPNLSGEPMVFIDCDTLAPSNMMHGKDGKSHNTVFMIPLNMTPYGSSTTYNNPDLHMYTIQYRDGRSLSSSLNCQLFDRKMRPLDYPPNMHVYMMFKVYHGEHD